MNRPRHSQPTGRPTNPISERLEHVRRRGGFATLKQFHAALIAPQVPGEPPFDVSYSATRNYHFDREPPASYLARVCVVFSINPTWLLLGLGDELIYRQRAVNDLRHLAEAVNEALASVLGELPGLMRVMGTRGWRRLSAHAATLAYNAAVVALPPGESSDEAIGAVASDIVDGIAAFVGAYPRMLPPGHVLSERALYAFVVSAVQGIEVLTEDITDQRERAGKVSVGVEV